MKKSQLQDRGINKESIEERLTEDWKLKKQNRRRNSDQDNNTKENICNQFRVRLLTVKLGLPGWILSSASTQIPLVSFSDWQSMSWPSTFRLATVKMLLLRSFCDTVSIVHKASKHRITFTTMHRKRIPTDDTKAQLLKTLLLA